MAEFPVEGIPILLRDGKTAGQMLTEGRAAAKEAAEGVAKTAREEAASTQSVGSTYTLDQDRQLRPACRGRGRWARHRPARRQVGRVLDCPRSGKASGLDVRQPRQCSLGNETTSGDAATRVEAWHAGEAPRLALRTKMPHVNGKIHLRSSNEFVEPRSVVTVLGRTDDGWFVVTSFPEV